MAAKRTAKANGFTGIPVGENVIIRTVTHYFTGRVAGESERWIALEDAAWVADTGRFAEALRTGKLSEVEPYPGSCLVAIGAVVDVAPWPHSLPRLVI
jgi:hypothetical protein